MKKVNLRDVPARERRPDSRKWLVWTGSEEQIVKGEVAHYFGGEEAPG